MRLALAAALGLAVVTLALLEPATWAASASSPARPVAEGVRSEVPTLVAERAAAGAADRPRAAVDRAQGRRWSAYGVELAAPAPPADPRALERELRTLLLDLRDDGVPRNAGWAEDRLRELGAAAVPALLAALPTDDPQQRRYVLRLLLEQGVEPDTDLLTAMSRTLEQDECPHWVFRDDSRATRALIRAGPASWDFVRPGLSSRDPQRRFLSAVVLAHTRCPQGADVTVTILAGHLRHNRWRGDAGIASRALFSMGDLAAPHLERLRSMPGLQARRLVALVLSELEAPSRTAEEAYARARRMAPGADGRPLTSWRFRTDRWFGLD